MKKLIIILALVSLLPVSGCNSTNTQGSNSEEIASESKSTNEKATPPEDKTIDEVQIAQEDDSILEGAASSKKLNSDKRVICWGTSLTEGTGGGGVTMPNVLERLSGATVLNYGGYAENTNEISARSGVNKLTLTASLSIDASNEVSNSIEFESEWGDIDILLKYTDAGLNPVTIDGVSGELTRYAPDDGPVTYYFRRLESGTPKDVVPGTVIIPYSAVDKNSEDINVIWTSGNDHLRSIEDIEKLIEKIDKFIEFSGSDKFIIFSDMNLHEEVPVTDEVSSMFAEYYGEHFLHFKKYLIEDALTDLRLKPSEEDQENIRNWEIPQYFRIDDVHGNSLYYYLAGQQVYKKCQELGYLE